MYFSYFCHRFIYHNRKWQIQSDNTPSKDTVVKVSARVRPLTH